MTKKTTIAFNGKGNLLKILIVILVALVTNDAYAQLPFNPGVIASGNQTICNGGDPNNIIVSGALPIATYKWYYKNGIVAPPTATAAVTGWTLISSATSSSYNPPAGLVASRTYACRLTSGLNSLWSSGARQVTVRPVFNPGTIGIGNQTYFTLSGNPSLINLSTSPSGASGAYNYQWYFKLGINSAPVGTAIPSGWTAIAGATSNSYDPPMQYQSITYALMVDPIGTPDCSGPVWASSQRQISINFSSGTLAAGNQTLCYDGDPANITFSTPASAGVTYQWYYVNAIVPAPEITAYTTGWTSIAGATTSSYNPPTGLQVSRTYACRVINNGIGLLWANGARQITIPTFPDLGVTKILGIPSELPQNDVLFYASGNPPPIKCNLSNPTGYTYEWYTLSGYSNAPNGTSIPAGWSIIPGATSDTYDPPSIFSTRSYACRLRYNGCYRWSTGGVRVIVTTQNFGQLAGALRDTVCYLGDPDPITFSIAPTAGATVNWYQTSSVKNPTDPITGLDVFVGSGLSYDPLTWYDGVSTFPMNRFYTPRVTIGSTSYWLSPRYINVRSPLVPGTGLAGWLELCAPQTSEASMSIQKTSGVSNVFVYQWFATDATEGYVPGATFCEWLDYTSPIWSPVGYHFVVTNDPLITTDDMMWVNLPYETPPITSTPISAPFGAYHYLIYKLRVTPVKSAGSLVPVTCESYNHPGCGLLDFGPEMFLNGELTIQYRLCGGSARYAATGTELENVKSAFLGDAYPNPAAESFTIDYELPENSINAIVSLYDLSGKTIKQIELNGSTGRQQLNLSVGDLSSGMYFYSLEIDGHRQTTKRISVMH